MRAFVLRSDQDDALLKHDHQALQVMERIWLRVDHASRLIATPPADQNAHSHRAACGSSRALPEYT